MKNYFHITHHINKLNQILLQLFNKTILTLPTNKKPHPINNKFQLHNTLINLHNKTLFIHQPKTILHIFYTIIHNNTITNIYSTTLHQLHHTHHHLQQPLYNIPKTQKLFLNILHHPKTIQHKLLPIHHHNILNTYIPQ